MKEQELAQHECPAFPMNSEDEGRGGPVFQPGRVLVYVLCYFLQYLHSVCVLIVVHGCGQSILCAI